MADKGGLESKLMAPGTTGREAEEVNKLSSIKGKAETEGGIGWHPWKQQDGGWVPGRVS